ncbi:hypothetical protein HKX48_006215 [Thoreauomyces humboldtii]|nr:hypothetical protein HKX48_006215 [Thoreauomyces humboldtii]
MYSRSGAAAPAADGPGPGSYDVKSDLLDSANYKRYGFIAKDSRFRDAKNEEGGDDLGLGNADGLAARPAPARSSRSDRPPPGEDPVKLKKECERWQDQYHRSLAANVKDRSAFDEKLARLEAAQSNALKEKTSLQTQIQAREREIGDLKRQHQILRNNLEKSDKTAATQQERAFKAGGMQKKLEDTQKALEKLQAIHDADQQALKSHRQLLSTVAQLRSQLKDAASEKDAAVALQLEAERRARETQAVQKTSVENAIQEKQELNNRFQKKCEELDAMISDHQLAIAQRNLEKEEHLQTAAKLQECVDEKLAQAARLETNEGHLRNLRTQLEDEKETAALATSLRTRVQELENLEKDLRSQLATATDHLASLKKEMERNRETRDAERALHADILQSLKKSNFEIESAHQKLVQRNHTEVADLKSKLAGTDEKILGLEGELSEFKMRLKNTDAAVCNLQEENTSLRKQLEEKVSEAERVAEERSRTTEQLGEKDSLVGELQASVERAETKVAQLDVERAQFQQDLDQCKKVLESMAEEIAEKNQSLLDGETSMRELLAENADLEKLMADSNDTLATQTVDLEAEKARCEDLRMELRSALDRSGDLEDLVQQTSQELEKSQAATVQLADKLSRSQADLAKRDDEVASLKEELHTARSDSGAELARLYEQVSERDEKLIDRDATVTSLTAAVSERETKIHELERFLEEKDAQAFGDGQCMEALIESLRTDLVAVRADLEAREREIEDKDERAFAAGQRLDDQDRVIRDLQNEVTDCRSAMEEEQARHATEKKELEHSLTTVTDEAKTLEDAVAERDRRIATLVADTYSLSEEKDVRITELVEARSKLEGDLERSGDLLAEASAELEALRARSVEELVEAQDRHGKIVEALEADAAVRLAASETAVSLLQTELIEVKRANEERATQATTSLRDVQQTLQDERTRHEKSVELLRKETADARDAHDRESTELKDMLTNLTRVLEANQRDHRTELASLEAQRKEREGEMKLTRARLERDLEEVRRRSETQLHDAKALHERIVAETNAERDKQAEEARSAADAQCAELQARVADLALAKMAIEEVKVELASTITAHADHSQKMSRHAEEEREKFLSQIADLERNHLRVIADLKDEMAATEGRLNALKSRLEELEASHTVDLDSQSQRYNTDIAALRSELDALRASFSAKDAALVALEEKCRRLAEANEDARTALAAEEQSRVEAVEVARQLTDSLTQQLESQRVATKEASRARSDEFSALKTQLMDRQNALSVAELKAANELGTKDVQIRRLTEDLRIKTGEVDQARAEGRAAVNKARKDLERAKEEAKSASGLATRLQEVERQLTIVTAQKDDDRNGFVQKFREAQEELGRTLKQLDRYAVVGDISTFQQQSFPCRQRTRDVSSATYASGAA